MSMLSFRLKTNDQQNLHCRHWPAGHKGRVKGVILLIHGMAEHCGRYHHVSESLNSGGYAVISYDQRGHGLTAEKNQQTLGHFADHNGWQLVIDDLLLMYQEVKTLYPQTPIFMAGHSMGSFVLLYYLMQHGKDSKIAGAILSASTFASPVKFLSGLFLTNVNAMVTNHRHKSQLVNFCGIGNFNRQIRNSRTPHDWICSEPKVVDEYAKDPLCGFQCTNQLWMDLFSALFYICQRKHLSTIPNELPLYMLGGEEDAMSNNAKGLKQLHAQLTTAGIHNTVLELYSGCRHEVLNETKKEQVLKNLISWLDTHTRYHQREDSKDEQPAKLVSVQ